MKDNNDILDGLFNKARNEAPKTSFEATKERFLSSIDGENMPKIDGRGGAPFFNLKNWIIMILSATAIVITTVMLWPTITTHNNKTSTESEIMMTADSQYAIQEHEVHILEYMETVNKIDPHLKAELQVELQLALKGAELFPLDTLKKNTASVDQKGMPEDTAYSFPKLTAEEIKANNKQKAKMLKQLLKFDKDKYAFIPSGKYKADSKKEVSINSFYMQTMEVTNLEYRTFLFDLLIQNRKDDFLIAKPDQTCWMKHGNWMKPMQDNYFAHPAYDDYPVVNISREGAEMYCQWITQESNNILIKKNNSPINDARIPNNFEWSYAASGSGKYFPFPWGGPKAQNAIGCYLANFKPGITNQSCDSWNKLKDVKENDSLYDYVQTMDDVKMPKKSKNPYSADGGYYTVKVNSYNPNDYGLFCMSGNVSEMVYYSVENNAPGSKGGNWGSNVEELKIDGPDPFKGKTDASAQIGFRPVISYTSGPVENPPGTIKVSDKLYMDAYELSNFSWQEYLMWQAKTYGKTAEAYKNALPDTLVWRDKLSYNAPYVQYYLTHPAYRDYPVVGVSYEQAVAYCAWRTDRVKELYDKLRAENPTKYYPINFKYRLPTKEEWEKAASIGYSEKIQQQLNTKYKGQVLANLKRKLEDNVVVAGTPSNNADITAPVKSYWPNAIGCYNLIGNVAEMTNSKGIAKGGSWVNEPKEVTVEKDIAYSKPSAWLGFRCVLEIE